MLYRPQALEHCYQVKLGSLGEILGHFLAVSGLSIEFETHEYAEGGRNDFVYRHRGRIKQSNLTLKSGVTSQTTLLDWALRSEPQDLEVIFMTADGRILRSFGFKEALPIRWTGPNASIDINAVATESLEVVHRGMTSAAGASE
jgi:phage tail-like protein